MEQQDKIRRKIVHVVIAQGYLVFLIFVIFGLIVNLFFDIKLFENHVYQNIGALGIILGTILIYWAQSSSSRAGKIKEEDSSVGGFKYGPYKYSHHPSYLGLFIMTLGLSLILNSLPSLVLVIIAYLIIKFVFTKKEEKLLEEKYGEIFIDYKKKIKK